MPRLPLLLLAAILPLIFGFWYWMGKPVVMPPHAAEQQGRVYCLSFAPFRSGQSPFDPSTRISLQQVEEDMTRIRKVTDCVRTYATDLGSQYVPEVARKLGMKVYLGIWIGADEMRNQVQIETALSLAARFPETIRAIIVGNEVLLRREQSPVQMAQHIRHVKSRTSVPVTYADVWEFWLRSPELAELVDFVTIHTLPYWEDIPISVEKSAAHIDETRKEVARRFPGKEILIGEVGWPSAGRMREGALPSLSNQARLLADVTKVAREGGYKFNWIEVIDQPWKRRSEGTVGGYWGLFEAGADEPKYRPGDAVSDHPDWRIQAGGGMALAVALMLFGLLRAKNASAPPATLIWLGLGVISLASGLLVGWTIEKLILESLTRLDWLYAGTRALVAVLTAFAVTDALVMNRPAPALPRAETPLAALLAAFRGSWLGGLVVILAFLVLQSAIAIAFDPRYRDFPAPTFTIALVPLIALMILRGRAAIGSGEKLLAAVIAVSAVIVLAKEGFENWQALWFVATLTGAVLLLGGPARQREAEQQQGG